MHTHCTMEDRAVIAAGMRVHDSYTDIANRIGKSRGTVCREINRNKDPNGIYDARRAHRRARERRTASRAQMRKIESDSGLAQRIEERLRPLVSPETIANDEYVCHATIYAWIYRTRPELKRCLPNRGRKRRKYGAKRGDPQGWTRHVRSIEERPECAESWEGDTLHGGDTARLLTHVESVSLYTLAHRLENGTADAVQEKLKYVSALHKAIITYDRGGEFALWRMIERDTKSRVYFAHPRSPWERGKNENTNGRIRREFPKRTKWSTMSQKEIDAVVWVMNHTKRKSLDWRTPCAVYGKCCDSG